MRWSGWSCSCETPSGTCRAVGPPSASSSTEQELACDDLAVGVTGRPLALASALAKVWQAALGLRLALVAGVGLAGANTDVEGRIRRLMEERQPLVGDAGHQPGPLMRAGGAAVAILGMQSMNVALLLVPMGCGSLLHMLGW